MLGDAEREIDTLKADNDRLRGALEKLQRSSELQAGALPARGEISFHAAIEWYQAICKDVLRIVTKALQDNPTTPGEAIARKMGHRNRGGSVTPAISMTRKGGGDEQA